MILRPKDEFPGFEETLYIAPLSCPIIEGLLSLLVLMMLFLFA